MFKKINLAVFTALILGNFSTSHADPCESEGTCQSLEAVYMCAKETNADLAKYLASDDVAFKKKDNGTFDYTVVERFVDYAKWYDDYKQYIKLYGQYTKLRDFEKLFVRAEKEKMPVDAKILNEFKNAQYVYYNNLIRYQPKGKTLNDLDSLESKTKDPKHLFVPIPKFPVSQDSHYKKVGQKVKILNKSFRKAAQNFTKEQLGCMGRFCQTNCNTPSDTEILKVEKCRNYLNLPMDMDNSDVIKYCLTTRSETCLDSSTKGRRQLLLCDMCGSRIFGKNDMILPSCDGLSDKEIYDNKKQESMF